jgi:hypothetical protein
VISSRVIAPGCGAGPDWPKAMTRVTASATDTSIVNAPGSCRNRSHHGKRPPRMRHAGCASFYVGAEAPVVGRRRGAHALARSATAGRRLPSAEPIVARAQPRTVAICRARFAARVYGLRRYAGDSAAPSRTRPLRPAGDRRVVSAER